ncbi:MAG: amidohydrolase [Chitinophagaceae bacterium]|nr:MAG: amidohydrolase [Chitinophagaceae bacterium]
MKLIKKILVSALMFAATLVHAQHADIIITNGKISTLDNENTEVQAVAITGNKIVQTGTNADVLKLKGAGTKIIDAKGNRVIPGLFDTHMHVIRGGRFYNAELRWDGVTSLKRALQILKEQAERTPEGQWVRVVGGWSEYQFEEKRLPTLKEINDATGKVPAFILYLYGKAWLNQAGLKKLNITGDTPNPPEGLIQKDNDGNPTGLLVAEPNAFIFQNFPDDYGITNELNDKGMITLRLPHFLFAQKKGVESDDYERWIGMVELHGDELTGKVDYHVGGGGENLVADAADFENFLFRRPELVPGMETQLKKVIKLLANNRWPFRLHATYNESITRFLNVIEEVNKETPLNGLVWFFDHAETVSDENLKRIKALGGGISVQHRMAYQGESFVHRYGKTQALASPPVKRMLALQIPVGLGTDGTRVASYNPWIALYWITTGKTVGGSQVMAQENTLDRTTALRLATHKGYELIRQEKKGKIARGYYADISILSKDYFAVADNDIRHIVSKLTIVDGKVVYGDKTYSQVAPAEPPVIPAWSPIKHFGGYQQR